MVIYGNGTNSFILTVIFLYFCRVTKFGKFTLQACSQPVSYERKLWTPGENQVILRVGQLTHYILHIPSKQALKLYSQPALQWTLFGRQLLQGQLRLLSV